MNTEKSCTPNDIFQECLEAPEPYSDEVEKETCRRLVDALPKELVTYCANTSYAYWHLARNKDTCPLEEYKISMAMREARRHLIYMTGYSFEETLASLTDCCQYRKDHNLDYLRTCFGESENLSEIELSMKEKLAADMDRQAVIIRGHDKERRAVLVKCGRQKSGTTDEEYKLAQLYSIERASACTEFLSRGRQEQTVTIFDYSSVNSSHSPPITIQLSAISTLKNLYPERLYTNIMLNAPFWMQALYAANKMFLPVKITQKVNLRSDRAKVFEDLGEGSRGLGDLLAQPSTINMDRYLREIPFYCPYNSEDYLSSLSA